MVFADDFIQFGFDNGVKRVTVKSLGLDWPPPEEIEFLGWKMKRVRYSSISDKDRSEMTHVCRGAEYRPVR